jgi:hypothetical protein
MHVLHKYVAKERAGKFAIESATEVQAGFLTRLAIYSEMLSKATFSTGNRSAFSCPSAHFNPTAATV